MNLNKIELGKKYLFKEEFCKQILEERPNVYNRKVKQFLQWLREFFIFDYKKSSPSTIIILDVLKEYEMFPRYDASNRIQKRLEREAAVEKFIREEVFKDSHEVCTSYSKISRDMQAKGLITEIKVSTLARGYVNPVLNRMADSKIFWYFKGKYYTEEEYKERKNEFFQEIYKKAENEDSFLEEVIYILKNKDEFNIEEKIENYEKAISIFVNDKEDVPIPKRRWSIKDEYKFLFEKKGVNK